MRSSARANFQLEPNLSVAIADDRNEREQHDHDRGDREKDAEEDDDKNGCEGGTSDFLEIENGMQCKRETRWS